MYNLIRKIKLKIKHIVRGVNISKKINAKYIIDKDDKIAVIFFKAKRLERHYYFVIKFLSLNGYKVLLIKNVGFLGSIDMYKKEFLNIKNVFLVNDVKGVKEVQADLYFFDDISLSEIVKAEKQLYVRIDTFNYTKESKNLLMPLPMSVEQYDLYERLNSTDLRNINSLQKIIYSGNLDRSVYDAVAIKNIYKKLSRIQIIDCLKNNLNADEIEIRSTISKVETEDYINKFILYDWFWRPDNQNLSARIENKNWLSFISQSDFFLCCPGVVMPPTHAVVEAMSVGCIPIIEYPEFYPIGLIHLENCLIFSDEKDLVDKTKYALGLSQDLIVKMKKSVINYYESNLSPKAFVNNIEELQESSINYFMYTDYSHL